MSIWHHLVPPHRLRVLRLTCTLIHSEIRRDNPSLLARQPRDFGLCRARQHQAQFLADRASDGAPPPPTIDMLIEQTLGPYGLSDRLGRGGRAAVHHVP